MKKWIFIILLTALTGSVVYADFIQHYFETRKKSYAVTASTPSVYWTPPVLGRAFISFMDATNMAGSAIDSSGAVGRDATNSATGVTWVANPWTNQYGRINDGWNQYSGASPSAQTLGGGATAKWVNSCTALTICAYVKFQTRTVYDGILWSRGAANQLIGICLDSPTNVISFFINNVSGNYSYVVVTNTGIANGTWVGLVCKAQIGGPIVINWGGVTNVSPPTLATGGGYIGQTVPITLARDTTYSTIRYYKGLFDNVMIYTNYYFTDADTANYLANANPTNDLINHTLQ